MSNYVASVLWTREGQTFTDNRYSRRHLWPLEGGAKVAASLSPSSAPLAYCDPSAVDPYEDQAVGIVGKDDRGRIRLIENILRPAIVWQGRAPNAAQVADPHHRSREACYITNALRASVRVESFR